MKLREITLDQAYDKYVDAGQKFYEFSNENIIYHMTFCQYCEALKYRNYIIK